MAEFKTCEQYVLSTLEEREKIIREYESYIKELKAEIDTMKDTFDMYQKVFDLVRKYATIEDGGATYPVCINMRIEGNTADFDTMCDLLKY